VESLHRQALLTILSLSFTLELAHVNRQISLNMKANSPSRPVSKTRRTRLSPEMRQAQLLECAITAFAQNGIERAVHADVAALSGVSTPTVFKYFATREVLVAAVLGEIERRILSLLARVPTAPQSDPQNRVRALATVVDQLCAQTPDQMKVALSWSDANVTGRDGC